MDPDAPVVDSRSVLIADNTTSSPTSAAATTQRTTTRPAATTTNTTTTTTTTTTYRKADQRKKNNNNNTNNDATTRKNILQALLARGDGSSEEYYSSSSSSSSSNDNNNDENSSNSSDSEEPEAPWMEGSVIRIEENPSMIQPGGTSTIVVEEEYGTTTTTTNDLPSTYTGTIDEPPTYSVDSIPTENQHHHVVQQQVQSDDDDEENMQSPSLINPGTFIKADTFIQSNDPKAEQTTIGNTPQDNIVEEEKPIAKFGMIHGCIRDRHLKHGILYFSNVIYLFAWWVKAGQWNANDCANLRYYEDDSKCSFFFGETVGLAIFVWLLMFGLFLTEFFCSSTGRYLKNINQKEDIIEYTQRLYKTEPTLAIKIECYHYETRVVYYTDSNGNSCSRTETYPVVTYTESEPVYIVSWEDASEQLQESDVSKYEVTKVKVHKTFTGDENFNNQCENFIERNKWRDLYYNFYVIYDIDGYKDRVLAFVDLNKKPEYLTYPWCLAAHLTLYPSLPYRIWMSSITGKVDTTVHKLIWTANPNTMNATKLATDLLNAVIQKNNNYLNVQDNNNNNEEVESPIQEEEEKETDLMKSDTTQKTKHIEVEV